MGEALLVRRGGALGGVGIFIEPGLIVEWFGLASNVPEGWLLCDGQNDTPNLVDQFIIGAGDTYAIGDTGGSADAIVPSHTHTGSTNTVGNHAHSIQGTAGWGDGIGFPILNRIVIASVTSTSAGSHTHSLSLNTVGESSTNRNLSPYLSLFHIIKGEE